MIYYPRNQKECLLDLLKNILQAELKKIEENLSLKLGSSYSQKIIQASWKLAIHTTLGEKKEKDFPELLPFPVLKELVLQTGKLIFYAWEYNEPKYQEALFALEALGKREFAQRAYKCTKRTRVICLFRSLAEAIRCQDKFTAAWLSENLKRWGYPTEVAATWRKCSKAEQIQA